MWFLVGRSISGSFGETWVELRHFRNQIMKLGFCGDRGGASMPQSTIAQLSMHHTWPLGSLMPDTLPFPEPLVSWHPVRD